MIPLFNSKAFNSFFPPSNVCCTGGTCDSGESHENDVILYAKIEGRREHIPLDTLTYAAYKVIIILNKAGGWDE